jgi:bifunctional DNA primase/polymerase-like protein
MSHFQSVPKGEAPKPSFEMLKPHLEAGHDLIPLKPLSVNPLHFDWPIGSTLSSEEARAHMATGGNIGVRLRPDMLVVDVSPHCASDGIAPMRRLASHLGMTLSRGPLVLQAACSREFYFRKPATFRVRRLLSEFSELRFASSIGQVLASGSVHPRTLTHCRAEVLQDVFTDAPEAPRAMLELIAASNRDDCFEHVRLTPVRLSTYLAGFRRVPIGEPFWTSIILAAYHATEGSGREQFLDWAISDPKSVEYRERIERLWDSLGTIEHVPQFFSLINWIRFSRRRRNARR